MGFGRNLSQPCHRVSGSSGGIRQFFGERFHFEGIYAVFLLAGRGAALLVERWQLSRAATAFALALLTVLQLNQQAATAITVAWQGEPYP